jgi:hypothetical protein
VVEVQAFAWNGLGLSPHVLPRGLVFCRCVIACGRGAVRRGCSAGADKHASPTSRSALRTLETGAHLQRPNLRTWTERGRLDLRHRTPRDPRGRPGRADSGEAADLRRHRSASATRVSRSEASQSLTTAPLIATPVPKPTWAAPFGHETGGRSGRVAPLRRVLQRVEQKRVGRGRAGDNSELSSVRGQLLVLDPDALGDRAASLGLDGAQLGLERRQALGRDVVGRTRRPRLSDCG